MKRRVEGLILRAGLLAVPGLAACAGAAAPAADAPRAEVTAPAPVAVAGASAASPPPPPAMAVVSVAPREASDRQATSRAGVDLVRALRELEASTGDCSAACRALGSMDRATAQLCALAASPDDTRTCDESKAKVIGARARVRAACGSCPNGTSVDPNAPVPSP